MSGTVAQARVDLSRVVQLRWQQPDERWRNGTGYLVGPRVVLTAAHCVDGTSQVQAKRPFAPGADGWVSTRVVWNGHTAGGKTVDAALLDLGTDTGLGNVAYAHPGVEPGRIHVTALGFPVVKLDDGAVVPVRDSVEMDGWLVRGSNLKSGLLEFDVQHGALPDGDQSPWAGLSGAAVLAPGGLVALLVEHRSAEGSTTLEAQPVHPLLGTGEVADLLTGGTGPAALADAWGVLTPGMLQLPADPSPALLLRPEYAVVSFAARATEQRELLDWLDEPASTGAWLWHSGAGTGKTRLAAELIGAAARSGWLAGFLPRAATADAVRPHLASGLPLFLVVDDAHMRPTSELVELLQAVSGGRRGPARLLLLARTAGPWFQELQERVGLTSDVGAGELLVRTRVRELLPLQVPADARASAAQAFASVLGRTVPPAPGAAPGLQPRHEGTILGIHAEALRDVVGEAHPGDVSAETWLLGREAAFWDAAPEGLPEDRPRSLPRQLAGLAVLLDAAELPGDTARQLLATLPDLADVPRLVLSGADQWLHDLYPGDGRWPPLRPDRVADRLLAELASDEDFSAALASVAVRAALPHLTRVLLVAGRAAESFPDSVPGVLVPLLAGSPERCVRAIVDSSAQATPVLPDAVARWLDANPLSEVAERCEPLLEGQSFNLERLAWTLTRQALQSHAAEGGPRRAELLEAYAVRIPADAEFVSAEAAAAAQEAVAIRRGAAETGRAADRLALAGAIGTWARSLDWTRDLEQVLELWHEAISLAEDMREEAVPGARGLLRRLRLGYASLLGDRGDTDGQRLALNVVVADLAAELEHEGHEVPERRGLREEYAVLMLERAIAMARDPQRRFNAEALRGFITAQETFETLAAAEPDHYMGRVPACLMNRGAVLQQMGRYAEGVPLVNAAIRDLRGLVIARPATYSGQLVAALTDLGNLLASQEEWEPAAQAHSEAVEILSRSTSDDPRPRATALSNLAVVRFDQGDYEDARAVALDGIRRLTPFAEQARSGFASIADSLLETWDMACTASGKHEGVDEATRLRAEVDRVRAG